ncbi:hypothetical protein N2152v2_003444 [Parachlorella kessleri]
MEAHSVRKAYMRVLVAAAAAAALAAALIAPAPYIISHPAGLATTLGLVNAVAPAAVRVESVSAGWGRPLVVEGLEVSECVGGRVLATAERVRTVQPLWQVATAQLGMSRSSMPAATAGRSGTAAPADIIISQPQVDCSLNLEGQLRVVSLLQQAGLVKSPPPLQLPGGAGQAAGPLQQGSSGSVAMPEGRAARHSSGGGVAGATEEETSAEEREGGDTDEETWSVGAQQGSSDPSTLPSPTSSSSSSSSSDGGSSSSSRGSSRLGQLRGLLKRGQLQSSEALATPPPISPSFLEAQSPVAFTGELRSQALHVYLADGTLIVPQEIRELLGRHIHVEVLQGAAAIQEAAADSAAAAAEVEAAAQPSDGGQAAVLGALDTGDLGAVSFADASWAARLPEQLPKGTGKPLAPVAFRVDSELMQLNVEGWQTSRGYTLVRGPATASMEFTPALSKYLLGRLNPLLSNIVSLRGQRAVAASLLPHGALWPSSGVDLRLEPLSVVVEQGEVLTDALAAARLGDSRLARVGTLEAQISPLEAQIDASSGSVETRRLDLWLATKGSSKFHLATWGRANLRESGTVDVTLCIAGDTLEQLLGLEGLPDGFGVPMHVRGTARGVRLSGVGRASRQVGLLLLEQKASTKAAKGLELPSLLQRELRQGLKRYGPDLSFRMPPPLQ